MNELLDIVDQPVDTINYKVPQSAKPVETTHSVVDVHKSFFAPPDSQDDGIQNMPGTTQSVELEVGENNPIQSQEMKEKSTLHQADLIF